MSRMSELWTSELTLQSHKPLASSVCHFLPLVCEVTAVRPWLGLGTHHSFPTVSPCGNLPTACSLPHITTWDMTGFSEVQLPISL